MLTEYLSDLKIWQIFLATAIGMLLAYEIGFLFGKWRKKQPKNFPEPSFGSMIGAVLGLLAFLLAFTFGMAANRFETRRATVVTESNAIGTTYLRSMYLDEPYKSHFQQLLKDYLQTRIDALEPLQIDSAIKRAEDIQDELWKQTVQLVSKNPQSIPLGLFIQSLNEMIDVHTLRVVASLKTHLPSVIWEALYLIAIFSLFALGFQAGINNTRSLLMTLFVLVSFSMVMVLIVDLDRPQKGFLRVSQDTIFDLMEKFKKDSP